MVTQQIKILSRLLMFPDVALRGYIKDMQVITERSCLLSQKSKDAFTKLAAMIIEKDLIDLQEHYVSLFDRTPGLSLHLFEHIFGDQQERSQAMLELEQMYRQHGFKSLNQELPDYLPMLLEFLAFQRSSLINDVLADASDVFEILRQRLINRNSPYHSIFSCLVDISGVQPDISAVQAKILADKGLAPNQRTIDTTWQEQLVTFQSASALNEFNDNRTPSQQGHRSC